MVWVKIDDHFAHHPKVADAGPLAMALQIAALCYCNQNLTDGKVPRSVARTLIDWEVADADGRVYTIAVTNGMTGEDVTSGWVIGLLVGTGMWHEPGHGCPDCPEIERGYVIHDYLDHQPSRTDVQADRATARRRWAMSQDPELRKTVRDRDGSTCRYCATTVKWTDRRGPKGGTYDHVIPMSAGGDESAGNIVVACRSCNSSKGPRTPDQAGMTLLPPKSNLDSTQVPLKHPVPVPVEEQKPLSARGADDPHADEQFNAFWEAYPRHHHTQRKGGGGSKKVARRRFLALSKSKREAAVVGAGLYARECRTANSYPKHAERWISAAGWEAFQQRDGPKLARCEHCTKPLGDRHDDGWCARIRAVELEETTGG